MKNRVFLYLFFMLVFVGCQKSESMEDFDALFTHKKKVCLLRTVCRKSLLWAGLSI